MVCFISSEPPGKLKIRSFFVLSDFPNQFWFCCHNCPFWRKDTTRQPISGRECRTWVSCDQMLVQLPKMERFTSLGVLTEIQFTAQSRFLTLRNRRGRSLPPFPLPGQVCGQSAARANFVSLEDSMASTGEYQGLKTIKSGFNAKHFAIKNTKIGIL